MTLSLYFLVVSTTRVLLTAQLWLLCFLQWVINLERQ